MVCCLYNTSNVPVRNLFKLTFSKIKVLHHCSQFFPKECRKNVYFLKCAPVITENILNCTMKCVNHQGFIIPKCCRFSFTCVIIIISIFSLQSVLAFPPGFRYFPLKMVLFFSSLLLVSLCIDLCRKLSK